MLIGNFEIYRFVEFYNKVKFGPEREECATPCSPSETASIKLLYTK